MLNAIIIWMYWVITLTGAGCSGLFVKAKHASLNSFIICFDEFFCFQSLPRRERSQLGHTDEYPQTKITYERERQDETHILEREKYERMLILLSFFCSLFFFFFRLQSFINHRMQSGRRNLYSLLF